MYIVTGGLLKQVGISHTLKRPKPVVSLACLLEKACSGLIGVSIT